MTITNDWYMDATEVVSEVPEPLKKLLRFVMRGFYPIEQILIMDLLIRNACMKESDIIELLKFDKKQMGSSIKHLKNDQFIKTRMKVEMDAEGKATKHNFYFINYTGFVNVVKYKLDHIRRKLETQERDSTSRASFKCPLCLKHYTDLEADHLFDLNTGTFHCMMCGSDLEEEQSAAPVKDARAMTAKFNEQIETLYSLLRECDKYKLAHTILEPAPVDIQQLGKDRKTGTTSGAAVSAGEKTWSGEATKGRDFGYQSHNIDVKVGDEAITQHAPTAKKEQPAWMTKSTVEGVNSMLKTSELGAVSTSATVSSCAQPDQNIMHTLLVHEKKSVQSSAAAAALGAAASDKSDDSDMEDVPNAGAAAAMDSEEEEVLVSVGDKKVSLHEAADLVHLMTDEQKDIYNKIARHYYADMYD